MYDIYSPEADQLLRLLLWAIPMGMLTERTIHLAMIRASNGPSFKHGFFFQSNVIVGLTFTASAIALGPALMHFSVSDITSLLAGMRSELPMWGWPLSILVWVHVFAPLWVLTCIAISHIRPSSYFEEA